MVASICLAAAVMPMTFSGGAIATPDLGRSFAETGPLLAWVVNAFMMVFGALPLIAGALADRLGRRKVFRFGLYGFVVTGLLLTMAPNLLSIDLLRGAQGLFAAATLAGGTSVLAQITDEPLRRRAFSLIGATFGLGLALGPVIAGWALEAAGWRGVFVTASILAALSLVSGIGAIPESRARSEHPFDRFGAFLFAGFLVALTFWAILVPSRGLLSIVSLTLVLATALFLLGFIWQEKRCPTPMFDLSLLEHPAFLGVQALPVATCFGFVSLLVIVPVQLIGAGYSEVTAGLISMALSAPVFLVPLALAHIGTGNRSRLVALGLLLAALGLFGLGFTPFDGPLLPLAAMLALIGCGIGFPWGLMDGLAIEVAPREKAGVATGMFSTVRVASEGIVLALVSAAYAWLIAIFADTSRDTASAIVSGAPVVAALRPEINEACRWLFWGLAVLTLGAAALIRGRLRIK
ncbi:MFS transporter [Segnochrobactraceae bacterium EtOH-i3]